MAGNLSESRVLEWRPFHVMVKPVAAACNLACRYCYYLNRPRAASRRMGREALEVLVRDAIAAQPGVPEIHFAWQGGEPTLAGIDFFREALAAQERYRPAGTRIVNALQTNGTLLDRAWAEFLAEHGFLVGISIDGPASVHDPLRRDSHGRATHAKTLRGLENLQRAGVQYNALTVVHRLNHRDGRSVYRFLRRIGVRYMQFIPLVERVARGGPVAPPPAAPEASVAPWTAPPDGLGQFLCDVFDEWLAHDVGGVFVQAIEEHVAALARRPAGVCTFGPDCSSAPIVEANGDVYSCDHYAFEAYRLGNFLKTPIGELLRSAQQREFGAMKMTALAEECRACGFLTACRGGCPKHRFVAASGGGMKSYLCPSYRRFFSHTARPLVPFAA
jgi:serine-type anaerobic sulfatase-maturating enzyme